MNIQRTAGMVIIGGVLLFIAAMVVSPRLYQEPDISKRVSIIEKQRTRWVVSQVLFGLGGLVPAIGFLLLTLHLLGSQGQWAIYPGAVVYLVGAVFGVTFVYRQTFDPVQYWQRSQPSTLIVAYVVLTLTGLFLYGVAFLQDGFPAWLSYLTVGSSVVLLLVFLISRGKTGFLVASVSYLVALIIGVVSLI